MIGGAVCGSLIRASCAGRVVADNAEPCCYQSSGSHFASPVLETLQGLSTNLFSFFFFLVQ